MKEFVVTQMKHGVTIFIEDSDKMERSTLQFTWQEIAGLKWAIEEITTHPAFQHREPRERPTNETKRQFVTHIQLVENDD